MGATRGDRDGDKDRMRTPGGGTGTPRGGTDGDRDGMGTPRGSPPETPQKGMGSPGGGTTGPQRERGDRDRMETLKRGQGPPERDRNGVSWGRGGGPPPEGAGMGTGMGWGPQRGRGMGTGSLKRGQRPPERDRNGVPIGGKDPPHPIAVGQRIHPVELQALGGQLSTEAHVARRDVHGDGAAPKEHLHGDPLCGAGKRGGGGVTPQPNPIDWEGGGHPTARPPWILGGEAHCRLAP